MHELIYSSIETRAMTERDLHDLLEEAREKNKRLGVTGLLFYYNKEFAQILEGDKNVIFELYERIRLDPRHRGVELFWDAPINERGFSNWSMGFATAAEAASLEALGFSQFIQEGISGVAVTEHASEGRKMMMRLRELLLSGG